MFSSECAPRMLTIRQCAATGILPEYTLRQLVKSEQIPFVKSGNRVLINYDRLVFFLNNGRLN